MDNKYAKITFLSFGAALAAQAKARTMGLSSWYLPVCGKTDKQLAVVPIVHRLVVGGDPKTVAAFRETCHAG